MLALLVRAQVCLEGFCESCLFLLNTVALFEVGGALGTEAEAFMWEAGRVAEYCRKGQGDLQHWSAMSWGGHWRQRIGVEIVRGLARCVERAAT